ncbi:hypothetical protein CFP65_2038 [Kitasatospora sp. MMS16-BH015]|uniref:hypothetical protein n=1 Tax=Kitasatospora sp. MMS16-BH015 TaxID=2018025 RepID=UPI000CA0DE1F|nr:hypothetical protein [Kitasatospora sp. MMS16-BH015]AUG76898.1 hypothetical protein CFP65_2038 [Kitasatospora sp. MMS16-BH015]
MTTATGAGTPPEQGPLLDLRTVVILALGLFLGIIVGCLTYLGQHAVAVALLAGVTATGTSVPVLHKLIGR